jgi:hypothetical protein
MRVENLQSYHFDVAELQYSWLARFLHDWIVDLAEKKAHNLSYDDATFGNLEAFKDVCYQIADGFKELAEDTATVGGPSRKALEALRLFNEHFTSLWRA